MDGLVHDAELRAAPAGDSSHRRGADAGRNVADIAKECGVDLDAAMERLLPATRLFFTMDEEDVRRILAYEHTVVCSDGIAKGSHPHPRVWGPSPVC